MDPHQPETDPIDGFLNQPARSEANECLQLSVFQRTARVLRRRRWLRRAGLTAGLATCYAAGILTMWLASSPLSPGGRGDGGEGAEQLAASESSKVIPAPPTSDSHPSRQPESALATEWQALDSAQPRPDLFRQAGDQYLAAADLESAMRCYRGALEGASKEDLEISANDNWLLIELKHAKKEKQ